MDRNKIIIKGLLFLGLVSTLASILIKAFTDSTVSFLWMIGSFFIILSFYIENKSQTKGEDKLATQLCIAAMIVDVLCLVFEFI